MRLKGDSVVKAAIDSQVTRENEWTKKSSTAVTCDQMFETCVEKNQIFVPNSENTWNYESSMRHEIPKAKPAIKESVNQKILKTWTTWKYVLCWFVHQYLTSKALLPTLPLPDLVFELCIGLGLSIIV